MSIVSDANDTIRRLEAELAEALEYETAALKAGKAFFEELNQARAELAEKERDDKLHVDAWHAAEDKLAAAQEEAKGLRGALERIRDDYGEVWGGSRDETWGGRRILTCMCCGEEHPDSYEAIVHDEGCPAAIAAAAIAARQQQPDGSCSCPFPRDKCPVCAHPCPACEAESLRQRRQQQPDGKPDPAPVASETSRPSPFCNAPLNSGGQCGYLRGHLPPCGARRPERKDRP